MTEKNWDSWKEKENYLERAIYRHEAERDQLQIIEDAESYHGSNQILFRDKFLGVISPEYIPELKLHETAHPHITILDKDHKLVAIIVIGD